MNFEIVIIFLLILGNGLLAMSEIAVVSARKVRLQQRAEKGDSGSKAALELANSPGRFLSTVQIGITLVGILTGAFGGATVAEELENYLAQLPQLARYSEALSVTVVVLVVTYFSLVLGELAPKQIGLTNPERIAARMAPSMRVLSRATSPLVSVLTISTSFILRVLGIKPASEPTVTEEEIKILIDQGTEMGVFDPIEEEMVEQVFRMGDRRVTALMTPRPEVVWLDLEDPPEENHRKLATSGFSSLPVARGSLDGLLGFVRITNLMGQLLNGQPLDILAAVRPPLLVPLSMQAFHVLERLKTTRSEMAFVLDEYGGIEGLVTLRDILDAIVGSMPDEEGEPDPDIVRREDGSLLLDGMLTTDEFKDLFDLEELPGEESNYFQTLGGFVITYLGRLPAPGDHFNWNKFRIEVVDMDGNRVDKILISSEDAG